MFPFEKPYREIYLVFLDEVNYFCSRFFKKGFKHVFALERQALGWVCHDPSRYDLACNILPAHYEHNVVDKFKQDNPQVTILSLAVYKQTEALYPRLGLLSCVSMIKYLLGFPCCAFTPYQLYSTLLTKPPHYLRVRKVWQAESEQDEWQRKLQQHPGKKPKD